MEDLNFKGFTMKESKLLDYPHASMAVRYLGKFHACSFGLRDKKPEEFGILKKIEEPLFVEPEHFSDHFDALLDILLEVSQQDKCCSSNIYFTLIQTRKNEKVKMDF